MRDGDGDEQGALMMTGNMQKINESMQDTCSASMSIIEFDYIDERRREEENTHTHTLSDH